MTTATKTTATLTDRQYAVLAALVEVKDRKGVTISDLIGDYRSTIGLGTKRWPKTKADQKKAMRNTVYQLVEHGFARFEQRARSQGYLFRVADRTAARRALKAWG